VMNVLKAIAETLGCFVLGVDHFGKVVDTGTRGSSAKEASADVVLALLGDKAISGGVTNIRLALRKRREMKAGVARGGRFELGGKRRVGGLEQHFYIALRQHGGDVAGTGKAGCASAGIRIDLDRERRRGKAEAAERAACCLHVAHKEPDMVEKDFLAEGELPSGLCALWSKCRS